jgi:hypothetical protein
VLFRVKLAFECLLTRLKHLLELQVCRVLQTHVLFTVHESDTVGKFVPNEVNVVEQHGAAFSPPGLKLALKSVPIVLVKRGFN